MALIAQEAEETALTVTWIERMAPNYSKMGQCTSGDFAYTLGLLEVTNQWKEDARGEKRVAAKVAGINRRLVDRCRKPGNVPGAGCVLDPCLAAPTVGDLMLFVAPLVPFQFPVHFSTFSIGLRSSQPADHPFGCSHITGTPKEKRDEDEGGNGGRRQIHACHHADERDPVGHFASVSVKFLKGRRGCCDAWTSTSIWAMF